MENSVIGNTMGAGHWLWMLVVVVVFVIPAWRICQRTGYPGWLGFMIVVPIVNVLFLYFIAFAGWPANKSREQND